jgi:hypothetical protein
MWMIYRNLISGQTLILQPSNLSIFQPNEQSG